MLYFVNSRLRPGVTRDQVAAIFKMDIEEKTWELIKKGVVVHKYFKVGDQPGVIALLTCESLEEARALINELRSVKKGVFEFDIEPVDHFPGLD